MTLPVLIYVVQDIIKNVVRNKFAPTDVITSRVPNSKLYLYILRIVRASKVPNGSEILNFLPSDPYMLKFDFTVDQCIDDYCFNTKIVKQFLTGRTLEETLASSWGKRTLHIQEWSSGYCGCPIVVREVTDSKRWLALSMSNKVQIPRYHIDDDCLGIKNNKTRSRIDKALECLGSENLSPSLETGMISEQFPTHIATIGDHYFDCEVVQILFHYPQLVLGRFDMVRDLVDSTMKRNDSDDLYDEHSAELIRFSSRVDNCEIIKLLCAIILRDYDETAKLISTFPELVQERYIYGRNVLHLLSTGAAPLKIVAQVLMLAPELSARVDDFQITPSMIARTPGMCHNPFTLNNKYRALILVLYEILVELGSLLEAFQERVSRFGTLRQKTASSWILGLSSSNRKTKRSTIGSYRGMEMTENDSITGSRIEYVLLLLSSDWRGITTEYRHKQNSTNLSDSYIWQDCILHAAAMQHAPPHILLGPLEVENSPNINKREKAFRSRTPLEISMSAPPDEGCLNLRSPTTDLLRLIAASDEVPNQHFLISLFKESSQIISETLEQDGILLQDLTFIEDYRPMHLASKLNFNEVDAFTMLCKLYKDQLASRDQYGCFPLHYHIIYGNGTNIEILLHDSPENIILDWVPFSLFPPLLQHQKNKAYFDTFNHLQSKYPKDSGSNVLHLAVVNVQCAKVFEILLRRYVDENTSLTDINFKGNTFLAEFLSVRTKPASTSFIEIIAEAIEQDQSLLEICDGIYMELPMFSIFRSGIADCLCDNNHLTSALLQNRSLLEKKNADGDTLLHVALQCLSNCKILRWSTHIVRLMQRYTISITKHEKYMNQNGKSALHEIVEYLRTLDEISAQLTFNEIEDITDVGTAGYAPLNNIAKTVKQAYGQDSTLSMNYAYVAYVMYNGFAHIPDSRGKTCKDVIDQSTNENSVVSHIGNYPPSEKCCNLRLDGWLPLNSSSRASIYGAWMQHGSNNVKSAVKVRTLTEASVEVQAASSDCLSTQHQRELSVLEKLDLLIHSGDWLDEILGVRELFLVMPEYGANVQVLMNKGFLSGFSHVLFAMRRIIQSLAELHDKHIVHGNLDLSHIVSHISESDFKFISYGQSFDMKENLNSKERIQDLTYPPPELLSLLHNQSGPKYEVDLVAEPTFDIYALGCCFSSMLVQMSGKDKHSSSPIIDNDEQAFSSFDCVPANQTEETVDIIRWMKIKDPYKRLQASIDILNHVLFGGEKRLQATVISKLKRYELINELDWSIAARDPDTRRRMYEQLIDTCSELITRPSTLKLCSKSMPNFINFIYFLSSYVQGSKLSKKCNIQTSR